VGFIASRSPLRRGFVEAAVAETEQEQITFVWPEWLNAQQTARYIGVSLSQACWYMRQSPPPWPYYQVTATKKLSRRADLDVWLEKVKVSATVPS
jgi:hypothetical protein